MKLVFLCAGFLAGASFWRAITHRKFKYGPEIQKALHSVPGLAALVQWYSILFLGVTFAMVLTYCTNIKLLTLHHSSRIPPWLHLVSYGSLIVGIVAFVQIIAHVLINIRAGVAFRLRHRQDYPWAPSKRQDMVLIVLCIPAIYVVMSVQSTARMWMIIKEHYGPYGKDVDLALYQENFDLAAACQYFAVAVFANLSYEFVRERAAPETDTIIRYAGFQGVHAWVLAGALMAVLDFAQAYANAHYPELVVKHQQSITSIDTKTSDAFSALTILCVYNMFLICRFDPIKDALGNANAKFMGTRLLLLIGQIQPKVLMMPLLRKFVGINEDQAKLLHSTLLTFECAVVAVFNFISWEFGVRKELLYDARGLHERREAAARGEAPLSATLLY